MSGRIYCCSGPLVVVSPALHINHFFLHFILWYLPGLKDSSILLVEPWCPPWDFCCFRLYLCCCGRGRAKVSVGLLCDSSLRGPPGGERNKKRLRSHPFPCLWALAALPFSGTNSNHVDGCACAACHQPNKPTYINCQILIKYSLIERKINKSPIDDTLPSQSTIWHFPWT